MESISVIIDSIIDSAIVSSDKPKKLNLQAIFRMYTDDDIKAYRSSGSYRQIVYDYKQLLNVDDEFVSDAYKNFNAASKRNYIVLLKNIIEFTENYINSKIYNKVKYCKYSKFSGKTFESLLPQEVNNSRILILLNVKNNTLLQIFGELIINDFGEIFGIEFIYSKKILCPHYICTSLNSGEITIDDIFENSSLIPNKKFTLNSSTFLIQIIY